MPGAFAAQTARFRNHRTQNNRRAATAARHAAIDAYAHAVAVSEGNAALQPVRQQFMQDLEAYYKYRHNNSTAGMQELINKYKVTPKP